MDYYFEQQASAEQHAPFGQLQLSPQHDAQSLQQQESDFAVADVFVAKNKPAAPIISAAAAIKMFFLIVVFLKVLKNGFFCTAYVSYISAHPEQRHTPFLSAVRTHHVEIRNTTYNRKTWLLR
jgi:hypothetical protein